MKLINILLKHIAPEDWPEKYPFAAQDNSTGNVYFYDEKPGVNKRDQCFMFTEYCERLGKTLPMGKKWSKNIVTRDEFIDQYNNPWIKWSGGDMPVPVGTLVDVQYKNKEYNYGVKSRICKKDNAGGSHPTALAVSWKHTDSNYDIIRYRVCPLTVEEKLAKIKELL